MIGTCPSPGARGGRDAAHLASSRRYAWSSLSLSGSRRNRRALAPSICTLVASASVANPAADAKSARCAADSRLLRSFSARPEMEWPGGGSRPPIIHTASALARGDLIRPIFRSALAMPLACVCGDDCASTRMTIIDFSAMMLCE